MRRRALFVLVATLIVRPASGQGTDAVVAEVERVLRRPLSTSDRRILADAARDWTLGLRALARRFAGDVASLVGLQAGQVMALLPDVADPLAVRSLGPEIESLRDRSLTARQKQRLADLDAGRRAEVDRLDGRFLAVLGTVGLDRTTAMRTLAAVRGR